ncbi:hypothetical protein Pcinc_036802 [Petrolisthes cinctipes]|uniref:Uncharacterized protein n=1 Tax=Petrolisthes cinctipes TaxID=88211 RepID=A0AAE1BTU5_PETCI|nr:hypothetical protein Pcinc_036802 [Petrolisthes cinctipes]
MLHTAAVRIGFPLTTCSLQPLTLQNQLQSLAKAAPLFLPASPAFIFFNKRHSSVSETRLVLQGREQEVKGRQRYNTKVNPAGRIKQWRRWDPD